MAVVRLFLALLLLTTATSSFAYADEGSSFDIISSPRKVLNGAGSDGLLASAVSQAVSVLQGVVEAVESALSLTTPVSVVPGQRLKRLSGSVDDYMRIVRTGKPVAIFIWASGPGPVDWDVKVAQHWIERASTWDEFRSIEFYKVDIFVEKELAAFFASGGFRMSNLPGLSTYKNGRPFWPVVGRDVLKEYRTIFEKLVKA